EVPAGLGYHAAGTEGSLGARGEESVLSVREDVCADVWRAGLRTDSQSHHAPKICIPAASGGKSLGVLSAGNGPTSFGSNWEINDCRFPAPIDVKMKTVSENGQLCSSTKSRISTSTS